MSQHQYTNHLIHETSLYLLQHAHNPVNWYPWGEEALQLAKQQNKPILVSIGYAACHWCHVMERESFEDESTAAIMNNNFINIKIDREERPDLDHIYMDAVQAITGSGGWPLNVFLTPDAKPFYGGTYFPPVRAYNRISWKELLHNIHEAYSTKPHEIEAQAYNLLEHLNNANNIGSSSATTAASICTTENVQTIANNILQQADTEWGGFGKAPKFPQTFSIQYLLRHYYFTNHEASLQQALLSIDKMLEGGIYDHVGGGLARYSTDNEWLAPHFEKMLYDNALLLNVLSEAYQLTPKSHYKKAIEHIIQFIEREMLNEQGFFYSALDADSEGVEGKFYTWSKAEIDELLQENSALFCAYFDVSENGNWEHTNILRTLQPLESIAATFNTTIENAENNISSCLNILLAHRSRRIHPALDDKMLLSWNALTITAYCKAYAAIGNINYLDTAQKAILFIENTLQTQQGGYYHTYKNGVAKINAFIDDYAYLIQAYLHLQEVTGNITYIDKAVALTNFVIENFYNEGNAFFNYTPTTQTDVIVHKKEVYDGATPSGNAVMMHNLHYLSIVTGNDQYKNMPIQAVENLGNAIIRYPTSFGVWASLVQQYSYGTDELVIAGTSAKSYLPVLLQQYKPNKILVCCTENIVYTYPVLYDKFVVEKTIFYKCKQYACEKPTENFHDFLMCI
jgi:uncharacterized protein